MHKLPASLRSPLVIAGFVSGVLSGFFAWPGLFYMGISWPIIPLFVVAVAVIWKSSGRRAALAFGLSHFIGCLCGLLILFLWIMSRSDLAAG